MKKYLVTFLGLLSLGSAAHATSLRDVRLYLTQVPTNEGLPLTKIDSVVVYGDGEVVKVQCDANTPRECDRMTIQNLGSSEIAILNDLITSARTGAIKTRPGHAMCFVAPNSEAHMTADNGSVFLMKGTLCTSITENTAPAAKILTGMLRQLASGQAILVNE